MVRCHMLQQSFSLMQARRQEELVSIGVVNHLDSCRFSANDIDQMCTYFDLLASESGVVPRLRDAAMASPKAPTSEEQEIILEFEVDLQPLAKTCPWWVRRVALQRHRFVSCGFSGTADAAEVYLLLYAIQSPFGAHFLKLDRLPDRAHSVQTVLTAGADSLHPHRVYYQYERFQCFDESQLPFDDEEGDIFVIPGLFVGEESVFTDCEAELFEHFARLHPQDTRQTRSSGPSAPRLNVPADVREQLLQENPWLTEADLPGHVARRFGAGGRGTGGG
jgi:hypothetical protein